MKQKKINGLIIYKGPSLIDGSPIVVLLTGINSGSTNTKTGAMVQTYIIREDMHPVRALQTGQDAAICGNCPHRPILAKNTGAARCYVNVGQGVSAVYKAYKASNYPIADKTTLTRAIDGKNVRFGTYGDPAAVPYEIFGFIADNCKGFTGYTHQWQAPNFDARYKGILMASVDNGIEQILAIAAGMRYFRVQIGYNKPLAGEITCPASKEGGYKTTCNACKLCAGMAKAGAKNIVIADHGIGHQTRAKLAAAL